MNSFFSYFHPALLRVALLGILIALGLTALLTRLWSVQVEQEEVFVAQLPEATTIEVRVPAVRGEIRDRNGLVLASNERNYALVVNLGELRRSWHDEQAAQGRKLRSFTQDLGKIYEEYLLPRLQLAGIESEVTAKQVDRHWRINNEFVSMILVEQLSWKQVAQIAARSDWLPGVKVLTLPQRRYRYGALAGHLTGYLRPGNRDDLSESESERAERNQLKFDILDDVGVAGVEASMDKLLRGTPGKRTIMRDVNGLVVGEVGYTPPVRGSDVYLTLDLRLQYIADRSLRDAGVGQGAAVVIDPRDGSLLAMASVPSFDPNFFIPSVSTEVFRGYQDPERKAPLLAQALRPAEPGSTFKIPVALAGGLKNLQHTSFNCAPYNPGGRHTFNCWIYNQSRGSHGSVDLPKSIRVSCNSFYYRYANAMGGEALSRGLLLQGLGQKTGIELSGVGEAAGLILGTDSWRRAYGHPANYQPRAGDLANASIGQGGILATPLQMAISTATVANGGKFYQPRLTSHAIGSQGQISYDNLPLVKRRLQDEGISSDIIEKVRMGMFQVVNEQGGTGRRAAMEDWVVAGKTGTAQTPRKGRSNSWFISFAPYESPRYAVCVLVRNGESGGKVAAPIAKRIFEGALALERNQPLNINFVGESLAHDRIIAETNYGEEQLADLGAIPEGGTVDGQAPELVNADVISAQAPLELNEEGRVEPILEPELLEEEILEPILIE